MLTQEGCRHFGNSSSETAAALRMSKSFGAIKSGMDEAPGGGAQSVKRLASAQVMISRFMSSSPASDSMLTARSLEPASDSVSPPLSLLLPFPQNK